MYYKRWELQKRIVCVSVGGLALISGLVFFCLDFGWLIWRSSRVRHCQNEWGCREIRVGMDFYYCSPLKNLI
jgi:predicted RNA-binding Zn-ribbon protein involved in translation (DUF1610 family)